MSKQVNRGLWELTASQLDGGQYIFDEVLQRVLTECLDDVIRQSIWIAFEVFLQLVVSFVVAEHRETSAAERLADIAENQVRLLTSGNRRQIDVHRVCPRTVNQDHDPIDVFGWQIGGQVKRGVERIAVVASNRHRSCGVCLLILQSHTGVVAKDRAPCKHDKKRAALLRSSSRMSRSSENGSAVVVWSNEAASAITQSDHVPQPGSDG